MTDLKELSPPEKKVVSKVLRDRGFTLNLIGNLLGFSEATAMRYSDAPTPEQLKEFEKEIEQQFSAKEDIIAAKALARMDEKMATARITEALAVYQTMRGKDKTPTVNIDNRTQISTIEFFADENKTTPDTITGSTGQSQVSDS